jgi:hypothetical protein
MGGVSRSGGLEAVLGDLYERFPLLDEKRSPKPPTLSAVQWQVLALARALDTDPFVLLAGEPRRDWRPTPPTRCSTSSGRSTSSGPPSSWFNRMPGGAVHRRPEVRPQPGHCPPAGDGSPHLGSLWRVAVTPATMVLGYQSFTGSGRQVGSDDDMYSIRGRLREMHPMMQQIFSSQWGFRLRSIWRVIPPPSRVLDLQAVKANAMGLYLEPVHLNPDDSRFETQD